MTFDRRCDGPGCSNLFRAARRTGRYCSPRCRKRAERARSVTLTRKGTTPHGAASDPAKPQVSGGAGHANSHNSPIDDLPTHLSPPERDRWVAILTSPGTTGWPGDCAFAGCKQPQAHVDELCMTHLTGKRQKRLP